MTTLGQTPSHNFDVLNSSGTKHSSRLSLDNVVITKFPRELMQYTGCEARTMHQLSRISSPTSSDLESPRHRGSFFCSPLDRIRAAQRIFKQRNDRIPWGQDPLRMLTRPDALKNSLTSACRRPLRPTSARPRSRKTTFTSNVGC